MQADPNVPQQSSQSSTDSLIREQSLIKALARALQIVEMTDLDEAIRIVGELEGDVALLVGGPIVLHCTPEPIVPYIEAEELDTAIATVTEFNRRKGGRRS